MLIMLAVLLSFVCPARVKSDLVRREGNGGSRECLLYGVGVHSLHAPKTLFISDLMVGVAWWSVETPVSLHGVGRTDRTHWIAGASQGVWRASSRITQQD